MDRRPTRSAGPVAEQDRQVAAAVAAVAVEIGRATLGAPRAEHRGGQQGGDAGANYTLVAQMIGDDPAISLYANDLSSVAAGGTVACLGLSYKADIDDLRESPSIHVIAALRERISNPILIVEPHVSALPAALAGLKDVQLLAFEEAVSRADAVVLLTDHKAFAVHDATMLQGKDIIDTRGGWIR